MGDSGIRSIMVISGGARNRQRYLADESGSGSISSTEDSRFLAIRGERKIIRR